MIGYIAAVGDNSKRDWEQTRLHFVCGVILGGLGMLPTLPWFPSHWDWIWFLVIPLGTGLAAAIFLDRFWDWWMNGF